MKTILKLLKLELRLISILLLSIIHIKGIAQDHPRIYITNDGKPGFLQRMKQVENVWEYVNKTQQFVDFELPKLKNVRLSISVH